jgi:hypothetical protein
MDNLRPNESQLRRTEYTILAPHVSQLSGKTAGKIPSALAEEQQKGGHSPESEVFPLTSDKTGFKIKISVALILLRFYGGGQ